MKKPKVIKTVDALAGAGKTFGAIQWALLEASVNRQKTAIVLKSKELIEQAYQDAMDVNCQKRLGVPVKAIHSDLPSVRNRTDTVSNLVQTHLDAADPATGEVMMLTEAAFLTNQHWPNRYRWVLICDEIPEVAPSIKANLPDNHHLLTQYVQLKPSDDKYSEINFAPSGKQALMNIAENSNDDDVNGVLSHIAERLVSPMYQNFVLTDQFNRLLNKQAEQFEVFSLLQPSIFGQEKTRSFETDAGTLGCADLAFKQTIVMGAAFEKSLMHKIWPGLSVRFEAHAPIHQSLRYHQHSCGPRLNIQYVFDRDWSKYFANQNSVLDGNEITNFEVLSQACGVAFGDEPFVFLVNKDREDVFADRYVGQGKQLSNALWA